MHRTGLSLSRLYLAALFVCRTLLIGCVLSSYAAASSGDDLRARWVSAISNDSAEKLIHLLQQSLDSPAANNQPLWQVGAGNGKTALMVACKVGDAALAKQLVALGANIKARTGTDGTAFMFAVLGDQQALAAWLLELGADVNAKGSNGWTSVMIAAAKGQDKTLLWLLQQGANANTPDVYGFSPLMRASDNGHAHAVQLLLSLGDVDVNWQDEVNNTALHYAVSADQIDIVQLLLQANAKANVLNRAELSSLDLAKQALAAKGISAELKSKRAKMVATLQEALQ